MSSSTAVTVIPFSFIYANQAVSVNCSNKTFVPAAKLIIWLYIGVTVCFHDNWTGLWLTRVQWKSALQSCESQRPVKARSSSERTFRERNVRSGLPPAKGLQVVGLNTSEHKQSNIKIYCGLGLRFCSHLNVNFYSRIDLNLPGFSGVF